MWGTLCCWSGATGEFGGETFAGESNECGWILAGSPMNVIGCLTGACDSGGGQRAGFLLVLLE